MPQKQFHKPYGEPLVTLDNGAIKVARQFHAPTDDYHEEKAVDFLGKVDHSLAIKKKKKYKKELEKKEIELNELVRQLNDIGRSVIVAFQGRDGAGKSGATARIVQALGFDMSIFQGVAIKKPTEEELAHPYLWRFFRNDRMPARGQMRVFDRSWAERVLVERVKELAPEKAIKKSYTEIRTFEWLLEQMGCIVIKLWLDITKDEQWNRLEDRRKHKQWKFTPDDLEAREHWDDYTSAANEMFLRTGTDYAPWYIISSEDKRYSRVTVLDIITRELRAAIAKAPKPSKDQDKSKKKK
jgi:polyphosphate kinase 2 (PPK2 family)